MRPVEAFDWLLDEFQRYIKNEITWREVRQVVADAESLREYYRDNSLDKLLSKYEPTQHRHQLILEQPLDNENLNV